MISNVTLFSCLAIFPNLRAFPGLGGRSARNLHATGGYRGGAYRLPLTLSKEKTAAKVGTKAKWLIAHPVGRRIFAPSPDKSDAFTIGAHCLFAGSAPKHGYLSVSAKRYVTFYRREPMYGRAIRRPGGSFSIDCRAVHV